LPRFSLGPTVNGQVSFRFALSEAHEAALERQSPREGYGWRPYREVPASPELTVVMDRITEGRWSDPTSGR
jgi:hypothetical protein